MITFTVSTKKGGVGKTTTSISLLDIFTELGYKCLGVDLDEQGNLSATAGINNFDQSARDLFLTKSPKPIYKSRGFDIIPGKKNLAEVERHIHDRYNSHTILKTALAKYADLYDVCVLDCSSSVDMITKNALVAANYVICPIAPEGWSFDGFDEIEAEVINIRDAGLNQECKIACVIIHKYHKHYIMDQTIWNHFDDSKYTTFTVREKISVKESQYEGVSVLEYDPAGTATRDLVKIGKELADTYLPRIKT